MKYDDYESETTQIWSFSAKKKRQKKQLINKNTMNKLKILLFGYIR